MAASRPTGLATRDHPVLGPFVSRHLSWRVTPDGLTGSIARGFGPGIPLPPGPAGQAVITWLGEVDRLSAVPREELSVRALAGGAGRSQVRWFDVAQTHAGLPVLGAGLTVAVKDGHVVYLAGRALAPVVASSRPRLAARAARAILEQRLAAGPLRELAGARRAFVPVVVGSGRGERLAHRLVWTMLVVPDGRTDSEAHHVWVDAVDGSIVNLYPEAMEAVACRADPRRWTGVVSGGIRPVRADDPEENRVFPLVQVVENGVRKLTDANGAFSYGGGDAGSFLTGRDFSVTCVGCAGSGGATVDGAGWIDLGRGGTSEGNPIVGNGRSTPAGRTAYYHLARTRELLAKWDVADFPQIAVSVNFPATCNALSTGYMVQFFRGGGGCSNAGEVRDIIGHELGHNWDRFDGLGITNQVRMDLSEWKADMVALLMGGDACIGESFYTDPDRQVTAGCSGVRDLDEKAPGRRDHALTPEECPTCATLTASRNDCAANAIHCRGEISGQAIWHLKQNLLTGKDYINGLALPGDNPALSAEQTEYLLEKWLLAGGPPMMNWKPDRPGVSPYEAITVEDDDDLDLSNGVPHGAYINAAFLHHGIAESDRIDDAANCVAPPDPLFSAQVEVHPLTGRPRVRIDWEGVAPGETVAVYRNWRPGAAFLPLARNLTSGPVFDENVGVGETLRYLVVAVASDGCRMISPGNEPVILRIERPEVTIRSAEVTESAGDGDGMVEPGEIASLALTVAERAGVQGARGLTASVVDAEFTMAPRRAARRRPPQERTRLRVRTRGRGGVVAVPALAAGGQVETAIPLQVAIAPDAPCPGGLAVPIALAGESGCWTGRVSIPLADGACQAVSGAHVRPVAASLAGTGDSGDGDGLVDNCETTTLSYRIANVGDAESGTVLTSLTSLDPAVEPVGDTERLLESLAPGAVRDLFFTVQAHGIAAPRPVSFSIVADAAGNAGAPVLTMDAPAEEDPTRYSTLRFDFDTSGEGWTGEGFRRSTVRAASGEASFHGGEAGETWQCQRLVSPVLRLGPGQEPMLTLQALVNIEPFSDLWHDRANVHLIDVATGAHTLLLPVAGLSYNASGGLPANLCHIDLERGWASDLGSFAPADFDLSPWAGREVRIEINYASDAELSREGIYVDDVTISDASRVPADLQSDRCGLAAARRTGRRQTAGR